jgi:branched-chain amino acid transport system permease protein
MTQFIAFALLGFGSGSVAASFGATIVVLYKTTGIINFAQASVAMWGAYVYEQLTTSGRLVFPLFGLPSGVGVGSPWPVGPALVAAVASSCLLGAVLYAVVFRRMSRAPILAQVVATIAVMLVIQGMATLYFGTSTVSPESVLSPGSVSIGGLAVGVNDLLLVPVTVGVAVALWAWFRYTRTGLACRATADSPVGALLTGLSTTRLDLISWVVTSGIAGLFGVLAAPLLGLSPSTYPLLVVPALAAALVGRLRLLGPTVAAGLAVGCFQSSISYFLARGWLPSWAQTGLPDTVPLVVIVIVLAVAGESLPGRGSLLEGRLPAIGVPRQPLISAGMLLVLGSAAILVLQGPYRLGLLVSIVGAVMCLSLVLLTGMVGQISLAQAAFAGSGAFLLSKLTAGFAIPFPLGPLVAVVVATIFGLLIGLPALRIRGAQLAIVTMALALAVSDMVFNSTALLNADDLAPVPNPELFGRNVGPYGPGFPRIVFSEATLVIALALFLSVAALSRRRLGMMLRAVRSSEVAAAAGGLSVTRLKLLAFGASSFIAACAGVLLAYLYGQASPDSFSVSIGLSLLAVAYLGGITSLAGAAVGGLLVSGGLVFTVINNYVSLGNYYLLVTGIGLLVTVVVNPDGIAPRVTAGLERMGVTRRLRRENGWTSRELVDRPRGLKRLGTMEPETAPAAEEAL